MYIELETIKEEDLAKLTEVTFNEKDFAILHDQSSYVELQLGYIEEEYVYTTYLIVRGNQIHIFDKDPIEGIIDVRLKGEFGWKAPRIVTAVDTDYPIVFIPIRLNKQQEPILPFDISEGFLKVCKSFKEFLATHGVKQACLFKNAEIFEFFERVSSDVFANSLINRLTGYDERAELMRLKSRQETIDLLETETRELNERILELEKSKNHNPVSYLIYDMARRIKTLKNDNNLSYWELLKIKEDADMVLRRFRSKGE